MGDNTLEEKRSEIRKIMRTDVWALLNDVIRDPAEKANIDYWINDFLERNPYERGSIDAYFGKASLYFGKVISDKRKIGNIDHGLNEITKSLNFEEYSPELKPEKPEKIPDSVGTKVKTIIERLEEAFKN